jgi:hypothetical protein
MEEMGEFSDRKSITAAAPELKGHIISLSFYILTFPVALTS